MEHLAMTTRSNKSLPELQIQPPHYHSVEFSINGLEFVYQFKLWNKDSDSMHILIKEDSNILNKIEVGNRFYIKYYSDNVAYPVAQLKTEISHITKDEEGRFKGHYIVGLSVADNQEEVTAH